MHEAMFYETFKEDIVRCNLCPHHCMIKEGNLGICAVRKNIQGKLYTLVYGKTIASHVDPVEKKPLFHFLPGSMIYSFATAGCNLRCGFCQNWEISQLTKGKDGRIIGEERSPKQIVEEAISMKCRSIAMTYNEPTIFFEYALDTCKEAKKKGLKTAFVSNGYISKEPIEKISKYLDAINLDLKSFNDDFYKRICGARLQPILDSIKYYHEKGVWIEITTLIVPGENDSEKELKQIAGFIASIDRNIPWHISRFHPDYNMTDKQWTPIETLHKAYTIGKKTGLSFVYTGNVVGDEYENTYCLNCKKMLIKRYGYNIAEKNLINGHCNYCSASIPGILEQL